MSPRWSRPKKRSSPVRVLLDECLPRRLKRDLVGHDARTAPEVGWASKRNGELLRLAEREFDVFLTVDRKLQHQQNLSAFHIAVVVLVAQTNTLADLQPLMPSLLEQLPHAKPGQVLVVGTRGESRLTNDRQSAAARGRLRLSGMCRNTNRITPAAGRSALQKLAQSLCNNAPGAILRKTAVSAAAASRPAI